MRRRVLHCIGGLGAGGAERQLATLTHQLPLLGWDVHVVTLRGGVFEEHLAPDAALHRIADRGARDVRLPLRIARLIDDVKPDLVQTWLTEMDIHGGMAAMMRDRPWIASERSSALAYGPRLTNFLRACVLPRADAIVANSHGGLAFWKSSARRQVQLVIPNAVRVAPAIESASRDGHPLIVFAGRLSPEKGLLALLEAVAKVRREIPVEAMLCGEGPMLPQLQAAARALGIENAVTFPGHVRDVGAILRRADVYVSISRFEGFPNAVQEAMACGTPLVVSDIPAHREFLDESAALLAAGDDAGAVAAAIADCVRERDAARLRAAEARRRVAAWSPERIAAQFDALYRTLLEGRA